MLRRFILVMLLVICAGTLHAQSDMLEAENSEYQFRLKYPADWAEFAFNEAGQMYEAVTEDYSRGYFVYPVKNLVDTTPQGAIDQLMEELAATAGEATPAKVAGVDGLEFSYTLNIDDMDYKGLGFAAYFDTSRTGLIFSTEVSTDVSDDEHHELYEQLKSSLVFTSLLTPGVPDRSAPVGSGNEATEGVYWQTASGGSFVSIAGETYTLTLNDVPEQTRWTTTAPQFNAGDFATAELSLYWHDAPVPLAAVAILDTGTHIVDLELSAPEYDAEAKTLTYTAILKGSTAKSEETPSFSVAEPLPASTLIIETRQDFEDGLVESFAARADDSRGRANCPNKTRPTPKC